MKKNNIQKKLISLIANNSLKGEIKVPSDKSISHRALVLGSLAIGDTIIENLLESDDIKSTVNALEMLGVKIKKISTFEWLVEGVGTGGFTEPSNVIDFGNSGTSARLILGAISTCPINVIATGDASLIKRPMMRIIEPLSLFGAEFSYRGEGYMPLELKGTNEPRPLAFKSNISSAQIKSSVLLGALNSPGESIYIEPSLSRDHTEKMLLDFGANIESKKFENFNEIKIKGNANLIAKKVIVPGDPSSAAFLIAAALLVEGSEVVIENVLNNPTRNGFLKTLFEMKANIKYEKERTINGEKIVNLRVKYGKLFAVSVPEERVVSMIDEFPILFILASVAEGKTYMTGLGELKVKESDRINVMKKGLIDCGINVEAGEDYMIIEGKNKNEIIGDALIETCYDHRIAMSFLCLSLTSKKPIVIDNYTSIDTSFPTFFENMIKLGAKKKSFKK